VNGEQAEAVVLGALASMRLPDAAIDRARDLLADRLRIPRGGLADRQRGRLNNRLVALRKQHAWGDITDEEYLADKRETEAMLSEVPDADELVLFDRKVLETMAANLAVASLERKAELVRMLAETVLARDRTVSAADIEWRGPVRPFFATMLLEAPPDGFEPPTPALGRLRSIH
jgi:hypothetical protein